MNISKASAPSMHAGTQRVATFQFCEVVDECLIGTCAPQLPLLTLLYLEKQGQTLLFHRLHYTRRLFHHLCHPRRLALLHALADSAVNEAPAGSNA